MENTTSSLAKTDNFLLYKDANGNVNVELFENSVSSILEHTAADGKIYNTKFYNLDAILSVGYRVNSIQATQYYQYLFQMQR